MSHKVCSPLVIKLDINNKIKNRKTFKYQWIKEDIKWELLKYLEMNENENTS